MHRFGGYDPGAPAREFVFRTEACPTGIAPVFDCGQGPVLVVWDDLLRVHGAGWQEVRMPHGARLRIARDMAGVRFRVDGLDITVER